MQTSYLDDPLGGVRGKETLLEVLRGHLSDLSIRYVYAPLPVLLESLRHMCVFGLGIISAFLDEDCCPFCIQNISSPKHLLIQMLSEPDTKLTIFCQNNLDCDSI